MKKVISRKDKEAIEEALGFHSYDLDVTFTENSSFEEKCKGIFKLGINWSAIGTVDPEEAKDFAKELTHNADVAKKFNALEIMVDRKINSKEIHDEESYNNLVSRLRTAYNGGWFVAEVESHVLQYLPEAER